ncbi:OprD family porin [Pseudomonas sp. M30-35]|uniref:OprD family porin n=1 Tax=Pseudomonas sp. M30-35 TaxID=1981174 RepID=UPI000B3C49B4|nr:OprD family porin [Pseudomonas sp. M30-35]ARU88473.1 hypothetical protein B9K09_11090 [Pseudomonas sp. M30-35]
MFSRKLITIACACSAMSATTVYASEQSKAQGFVEDSSLNVLLRNTYLNRDFNDGVNDAKTWGQGFIGTFESGFTQGTVGVGVDAFGLLGIKLDSGRGRNVGSMFDTDSDGRPVDDISQGGAAIKVRFSNTLIKYGNQFPSLPVLAYDDSRLLPQSFTGTLVTSNEIEGLELNAGRFTGDSPMADASRDPNRLKSIDVVGGSYVFTDDLSSSLYYSDVEDEFRKTYVNLNYNIPLATEQALNFDFNLYHTTYDDGSVAAQNSGGDGNNDRNTIWSLAAKYSIGAHAFTIAHQRSSGDAGYAYDYGDGGNAIYLKNSYYSDFDNRDENSWQASYELDFSKYGVPGLQYKFAYVRGDNIYSTTDSDSTEREIFNQLSYVLQNGPAKDLSLRVRNSIYRASNNLGPDLNEIRAFIEYPLSIL